MTTTLAALALALVLCGGSPGRVVRRRADRLRPVGAVTGVPGPPVQLAPLAGTAAAVLCLAVFGAAGIVYAVAAAPSAHFAVAHLTARSARPSASAELRALPLVLDLLAAAVRSGAPLPLAVGCVAQTATGHLQVQLTRTAALLRLGANSVEAWAPLAADPVLAPLAAVAARSSTSGIRLADGLVRQADSLREQMRTTDVKRAQRVGVIALLPLGVCFLPAFVCLGIAPIVVGIAGKAFAGAG